MYRVILYFGFGAAYAKEKGSDKALEFETLKQAEDYGRSKPFVFEAVKVKETVCR